jgi:arginine N-succinyltransferase
MTGQPTDYVLRPSRLDDFDAVLALIGTLKSSMTSMPPHPEFIEQRLHKSQRAFYPSVSEPGDEQYLFSLEGPQGVVGITGIYARVGGFEPFYTYAVDHEDFVHQPLDIAKEIPTLKLHASHDGPTEIGSLLLHPDCRKSGLGRLLSLARFLFMAQFPERFREHSLAELRGYINEEGKSPFWECVGKLFFESEFTDADFLSGLGNKSFIRDLMPRHPLYTNLLPYQAQEVIGRVHNNTRPAKALLESEGFAEINCVDIFDAGPVVQATTRKIRTIAESKWLPLREIVDDDELPETPWHAANGLLAFRACLARAEISDDGLRLGASAAERLQVQTGDHVRLATARP